MRTRVVSQIFNPSAGPESRYCDGEGGRQMSPVCPGCQGMVSYRLRQFYGLEL